MEQAHTSPGTSAAQLYSRPIQILVSSKEPGISDCPGKLLLKVSLKVSSGCTLLLLQTMFESHGVQSADGHSLPIDGVESANGVSDDDQTSRPALHTLE